MPAGIPNQIRSRVKTWRAAGYPGVTGITERLLLHSRERQDWEQGRRWDCAVLRHHADVAGILVAKNR